MGVRIGMAKVESVMHLIEKMENQVQLSIALTCAKGFPKSIQIHCGEKNRAFILFSGNY